MKKTALIVVCIIVALAAAALADPDPKAVVEGTEIGQRIPQFTAQAMSFSGAEPQTTEFDSHKTTHVTAYVFVGTTCPATNAYAERFKQLEQTYAPKHVDFLFIYPNNNDTTEAKQTFHKDKKFTGRLIDDQGARLARLFKAKRTSELFLADQHGIVVYHGALDDSHDPAKVKEHYLATALDELLAGKPVTTAHSEVFA